MGTVARPRDPHEVGLLPALGLLAAVASVAAAALLALAAAVPVPVPAPPSRAGGFVIVDGVAASPVTVTLQQDGFERQYQDVRLPATYDLRRSDHLVLVSVIAGARADSIACSIRRADGVPVRSAKRAGGPYSSVFCAVNLDE